MKSKKTIAVVAISNRGGGSETFLRGILPGMLEDNAAWHYHLFIGESSSEFYEDIAENLTIHKIPDEIVNQTARRMIFDNITIYKELKKINPNLCFITSEVFSPLLKFLKVPIVNMYHSALQFYMIPGTDEPRFRLYYTRIMRRISIMAATKTVAVSHFERAEVGGRFPKSMMEKIIVIYHGLDQKYFKEPCSICSEKVTPLDFPYILCVGDRHKHKKIDEMIEIYAIMKKDHNITEKLVIIGREKNSDYETKISKLIEEHNLGNDIVFIDYIDNYKIREYYWAAKIYWTNSSAESFGLTPLEAMACGVPVLSIWHSALPEIYGDAARFYNPYIESTSEIAKITSSYLNNEELRNEYKQRGLQHIKKFSWDRTSKEYTVLFKRMLINT